jgi:LPXTG-motif cell wall-anchored protein
VVRKDQPLGNTGSSSLIMVVIGIIVIVLGLFIVFGTRKRP